MFLTQVQQSVQRLLAAHPFFAGDGDQQPIPVLAGNDKALISKAAQSISKLGLCVIVYPLGGDYDNNSSMTPIFERARFTCRVRENQVMNRGASGTGQPGDYVAEVIGVILKNHKPLAADGETPLGGGGIVLDGLIEGEDMNNITAWDLVWNYSGGVTHEAVRRDFSTDPLPGSLAV